MVGVQGKVFDIGYQRYTGPREGRSAQCDVLRLRCDEERRPDASDPAGQRRVLP